MTALLAQPTMGCWLNPQSHDDSKSFEAEKWFEQSAASIPNIPIPKMDSVSQAQKAAELRVRIISEKYARLQELMLPY